MGRPSGPQTELAASLATFALLGLPIEWAALIMGCVGVLLGGLGLYRMSVVVDRLDELNATLEREVSSQPPARPTSDEES